MQVINKAAERQEAQRKEAVTRTERARTRVWLDEKEPGFYLGRGVFEQFVKAQMGASLKGVYGSEMSTGAQYINQQVEAAEQFFPLALRDRHRLTRIAVDNYKPVRGRDIPLNLPDDLINELRSEASSSGVSLEQYATGIVRSTVEMFVEQDRAAKEIIEQNMIKVESRKITGGYISEALADALEAKYGVQKYGWVGFPANNYPIFTYWDMMVKTCEEYLGIKK